MNRYLQIYFKMSLAAMQQSLVSRFGAFIFIVGKFLRFGFFLAFLWVIGKNTKLIAGYSLDQMIFFFLTYQLLDTIPQSIFREVYRFRNYVVTGDFDYFLVKPISPLFRALLGGSDILDFPIIALTVLFLIFVGSHIAHSPGEVITYLLLLVNAFVIAVCFHVFILCLGIVTTEVDNAMMLYRDLTLMGRFPIDIYREPLKGFLTFIVPVGIMMTVPAKGIMGLLSLQTVFISVSLSIIFVILSSFFWRLSLRNYTSASS